MDDYVDCILAMIDVFDTRTLFSLKKMETTTVGFYRQVWCFSCPSNEFYCMCFWKFQKCIMWEVKSVELHTVLDRGLRPTALLSITIFAPKHGTACAWSNVIHTNAGHEPMRQSVRPSAGCSCWSYVCASIRSCQNPWSTTLTMPS